MSTSATSYVPATFTRTTEIFEQVPATSQGNDDFAQWEKEWEEINPPVSSTGGTNSSTGSTGSSMSSGLLSALLPILSALIAWMSQAMSSDSSGSGGGGDSGGGFEPASYTSGGNGSTSGKPVSGSNPAAIAESLKGRSADSIVANQDVRMDHGISDHEDCANFASACLVKSGEIPQSQHTDSVATLRGELLGRDGWHEESKGQVKPGDICIVGGDQHVEIVAGIKNGQVELIGSNNTLPSGAQAVGTDSYTGNQGNVDFLSA